MKAGTVARPAVPPQLANPAITTDEPPEEFARPGDPGAPPPAGVKRPHPISPRNLVPGLRAPPANSTEEYLAALTVAQQQTIPKRSKAASFKAIPFIYRSSDRTFGETFMNLEPNTVGLDAIPLRTSHSTEAELLAVSKACAIAQFFRTSPIIPDPRAHLEMVAAAGGVVNPMSTAALQQQLRATVQSGGQRPAAPPQMPPQCQNLPNQQEL